MATRYSAQNLVAAAKRVSGAHSLVGPSQAEAKQRMNIGEYTFDASNPPLDENGQTYSLPVAGDVISMGKLPGNCRLWAVYLGWPTAVNGGGPIFSSLAFESYEYRQDDGTIATFTPPSISNGSGTNASGSGGVAVLAGVSAIAAYFPEKVDGSPIELRGTLATNMVSASGAAAPFIRTVIEYVVE